MQIVKGEIVVEFMPEGNSIPADIPRMIDKMREGHDLVIGSRYLGGAKSEDDDWFTAQGNWLFTFVVNILFWARYTDVLMEVRAYRRSVALTLGLDAPGLSWPCQSSIRFARAGLQVSEILAHEPPRIGATRKMKPSKTGCEICTLIMRDFLWFRPNRKVA